MNAHVALTRGDDRYDNIARALDLVADDIDLRGKQSVLIKPNFVSTTRQLAATHVDAVRAVLDMLRARYDGKIMIAEGSALAHTPQGFARFGYRDLAQQYNVELRDLNADDALPVQAYDRQFRPQTLRLARSVVESDYRISAGPPKTHDTVIVTLALKNMIMGSLINPAVATAAAARRAPVTMRVSRMLRRATRAARVPEWMAARLDLCAQSDKLAMHQGFPVMNLNLALLAPLVRPHLAVIDGFAAMEGAGPVHGDAVDWRVALAGIDALAVDTLVTHLMGFDPAEIGYLAHCRRRGLGVGDLARIAVRGEVPLAAVRRSFRPHPTYQQQRLWQMPQAERWLQPATTE